MAKKRMFSHVFVGIQYKSSQDSRRIPKEFDVLNQVNLMPSGISALAVAGTIGASPSNVLRVLHSLKSQGYVHCLDTVPTTDSLWQKVDKNPRPLVIVRSTR